MAAPDSVSCAAQRHRGYRYNHVRALVEAVQAGAASSRSTVPWPREAFGAHFDGFFRPATSARKRQSIKEYWDQKDPDVLYNLKGWMAEEIVSLMGPHHSLGPVQVRRMSSSILPSPRVRQLIAAKLDRIELLGLRIWCRVLCTTTTTITGLQATAEGKDVTLYGDGKAGKGDEERLATNAVALGRSEVAQAFALGGQGMSANDVVHKLLGGDRLYSAERLLPCQARCRARPSRKGKRDFPDVDALLNDGQFAKGRSCLPNDKAAEITSRRCGLFQPQSGRRFKMAVDPLRASTDSDRPHHHPLDPTLTDSAAGHNTDDHSNDYWKAKRDIGDSSP